MYMYFICTCNLGTVGFIGGYYLLSSSRGNLISFLATVGKGSLDSKENRSFDLSIVKDLNKLSKEDVAITNVIRYLLIILSLFSLFFSLQLLSC